MNRNQRQEGAGRARRGAAHGLRVFLLLPALLVLTACGGLLPDTGASEGRLTDTVPAPVISPPSTPVQDDPMPELLGTEAPEQALTVEPEIAAIPDCSSPATLTPSMMEGPYYTQGSPERTSLLEEETVGTRLILRGTVLTEDCQPVPGAWLDFWQTDGEGVYDNAGYRLRGHQYTDEMGRYRLETVVPGLYPGRTAHIHVKVQAPGGPTLTTQLFMPEESGNQVDLIFSPELVMAVEDTAEGLQATYNFVIVAPQP